MIKTRKTNPKPDEWSEQEWLYQCCLRKAMSFRQTQKQRSRERNRKGLTSNLHIVSTVRQLTQMFYEWCANDTVCRFCQEEFLCFEDITVDHLTPVHKGGTSLCDNLAPAHKFCNAKDGARNNPKYVQYFNKD